MAAARGCGRLFSSPLPRARSAAGKKGKEPVMSRHTRVFGSVVLGMVVLGAWFGAGRARADQATASGTWNLLYHTQTPTGTAGGNQFFSVVESPLYVGGLSGAAVDTY